MFKICIERHLVVDIFPWCNANFVPFPSGKLVARRMRNGRINKVLTIVFNPRLPKEGMVTTPLKDYFPAHWNA